MEDLTPSTTTEQTFLKNVLLWPLWRDLIMKQEWHCVHYFVGFFWLTLFRHTPISCILFVPGPTSSTWKHPVQCTYTTLCVCVCVCVCVTYSTWALFTLLMCKQAFYCMMWNMLQSTRPSRLGLSGAPKQVQLYSAGGGGSTQSFPWMASHSHSCFSFHTPARHT